MTFYAITKYYDDMSPDQKDPKYPGDWPADGQEIVADTIELAKQQCPQAKRIMLLSDYIIFKEGLDQSEKYLKPPKKWWEIWK